MESPPADVAIRPRLLRDETGAGLIRTLITLAIVASTVYLALKFIPVKAASYQFDDAVREQVVLAGARRRRVTEQQIRSFLLERAEDLGLPIQSRDISVHHSRDKIRIGVKYTVQVKLLMGYVYDWNFDAEYSGPAF